MLICPLGYIPASSVEHLSNDVCTIYELTPKEVLFKRKMYRRNVPEARALIYYILSWHYTDKMISECLSIHQSTLSGYWAYIRVLKKRPNFLAILNHYQNRYKHGIPINY